MSGHRRWNDLKDDLRASGFLTPEREARIAEIAEQLLAEMHTPPAPADPGAEPPSL